MWMCFLVKFYIPLFWKIGNIWRVKNSTEMWSLVALHVLYLTFFFISSFLTTWHFHSLMRLFRVPRAGFKDALLPFYYWKITGQTDPVWQQRELCTRGTAAHQYYSADHRARRSASSDGAACRSPLFECVCSSLSLLVIVVFCFVLFLFSMQMWCNILIFFGSKLDWKLYCVIIFVLNVIWYSSCK